MGPSMAELLGDWTSLEYIVAKIQYIIKNEIYNIPPLNLLSQQWRVLLCSAVCLTMASNYIHLQNFDMKYWNGVTFLKNQTEI